MESVINWVITNIEEGRILTTIRVCEPYASELITRDIVTANIVFSPLAGEEHQIVSIDNQSIIWRATLTV